MALVEMGQHLGIAAAAEHVPLALENTPQFEVVVKLAVLNCPDPAAFVSDWLVASLDVDDTQPANSKGSAVGEIKTTVVRPSMRHHIGHSAQPFLGDKRTRRAFDLDDSADAAHRSSKASCYSG